MKIGELRGMESHIYPSADAIVAAEIKAARASYPNATSDVQALAFSTKTLRKNLAERTENRDQLYAKAPLLARLRYWLSVAWYKVAKG